MTEEVLSLIDKKLAEHTASNNEQIKSTIEKVVNGGIRHLTEEVREMKEELADQKQKNIEHNEKHEKDMADIKPIIELYQSTQNAGTLATKLATFVAVIGGAALVVIKLFGGK